MYGESIIGDSESIVVRQDETFPVVLVRNSLGAKWEDRYMLDVALTLKSIGYKVTFVTNKQHSADCFDELNPIRGIVPVVHSGWWIPESILGMFRKTMSFIKSFWLAMRLILLPPNPKPKMIILDSNPFCILILKALSSYRIIYIHHFPFLKRLHTAEYRHLNPDNNTGYFLNFASEIVVETRCLIETFSHFYPKCKKVPKVLHPCVDVGEWNLKSIPLSRIVPDIGKNSLVFVVFGNYSTRSNFRLALDSLEYLLRLIEEPLKSSVHMIIAGDWSDENLKKDESRYLQDLEEVTSEKSYGSQVTFLKGVSVLNKKTLIENSVAVVHPKKKDPFPDPILAAMSLGKAIIAVKNGGFAEEVLTHRISGILVDPIPERFAIAMKKIAEKPTVQQFVGQMAKDTFTSHFSHQNFTRKLHNIVLSARKNI